MSDADAQADAWDEGYRFGRLMQFDADYAAADRSIRRNHRVSLVAALDSAERTKSNHDNPYRPRLGKEKPDEGAVPVEG